MIKRIIQSGFTLIEMVMAIMILSIMMLISFFCFNAVVSAWNTGLEVSDAMGQADYVMEQLVSGLRSAYFPDTGVSLYEYGFQLYDNGEDEDAMDSINWVKLGSALVGEDCGFAESPHRIGIYIGGDDDERGLRANAWRVDLQLEDFDPSEDVKSIGLSPQVIAFNCRVLDKDQPEKDDEPNWEDEWSTSNCIPKAVELTLYMEPPENSEDDEPIEVKRIVKIPLWDISQNPRKQDDETSSTSTRTTGASSSGGVSREMSPGGTSGSGFQPGSGVPRGGGMSQPGGGMAPPAGGGAPVP